MKAENILYVLAIIASLFVIYGSLYVTDIERMRKLVILSQVALISAYISFICDRKSK